MPNCTSIHLNGYWMVNALQSIEVGTILSIDLLSGVEAHKRKETLGIKMDCECECEICEGIQLKYNSFTTI